MYFFAVYMSSLFCLSYRITMQTVYQVSEEGTYGRGEDDRGGQENDPIIASLLPTQVDLNKGKNN